MTTEYPVGRCADPICFYGEPHRHGFDCDPACECDGIGAETEPLSDGDLQECDWGWCSRKSVGVRKSLSMSADQGEDVWLAVCSWHAGRDDRWCAEWQGTDCYPHSDIRCLTDGIEGIRECDTCEEAYQSKIGRKS